MSTRTLGPVSADFVQKLQEQDKIIFTLLDAIAIYQKTAQQTSKFIGQLVKRGVVAPIQSGVFIILLAGQEYAQLTNWPVIARALVAPEDYFISHYSAMRLHGMTTHPLLWSYVTLKRQKKDKVVSVITYHFVYCAPKHFWGYYSSWISKYEKVMVSDLERTILDALDRPELCGGLKEVVRGIWMKQAEIDWHKMVTYADKFRTMAAVKRLGFVLEILDIAKETQKALLDKVSASRSIVLADSSEPACGKRWMRWRVRVNIPVAELKAGVWG